MADHPARVKVMWHFTRLVLAGARSPAPAAPPHRAPGGGSAAVRTRNPVSFMQDLLLERAPASHRGGGYNSGFASPRSRIGGWIRSGTHETGRYLPAPAEGRHRTGR